MNDSDVSSKMATRRRLRPVFLSIGIDLVIGAFGVFLGGAGLFSAGTIGIEGVSDPVADLLLWSFPVVCLGALGNLVFGIISATRSQERASVTGCALAAVVVCSLGAGLVYVLGWLLFLLGKMFHF